MDLAESSGETGRYFAAAKDVGFYDLALKFAGEGRTDPRTLSRASRDFAGTESMFAMTVGRLVRIPGFRDNSFRAENDIFSIDQIAMALWRIVTLKLLKRNNCWPSSARSD